MDRGELLRRLHLPKTLHRPLPASQGEVCFFRPVIGVPTKVTVNLVTELAPKDCISPLVFADFDEMPIPMPRATLWDYLLALRISEANTGPDRFR